MADRKKIWAAVLSLIAVLSVTYRVLTWKRVRPAPSAGAMVRPATPSVETEPERLALPGTDAGRSGHRYAGPEEDLRLSVAGRALAEPFVPDPLPEPGPWRPLSREGGEVSRRVRPEFVLSGTVGDRRHRAILNHQVLVAGDTLREGGEVLAVGPGWARLRWEGEELLLLVHPQQGIPLRATRPQEGKATEGERGRKVKVCYP